MTLNNSNGHMAHADRDHSKIGPSSIHRAMNCLVSLVPPPNAFKQLDTEYSREGTVAHELLEAVLTQGKIAFKTFKPKKPEDAKFLTQEMKGHIFNAHKEISKIYNTIGEKNLFQFVVETKVKYSEYIYGTLDVGFLYIKDGIKKALIFDLKYGSEPVYAERNPQLMTYLVALCDTFGFPATEGSLWIYQPRSRENPDEPVSRWRVGEKDIKEWRKQLKAFEKKAIPILEDTVEKLPKEVVGSHCKYCPRMASCEAYRHEASASGLILLGDAEPLPVEPAPLRIENGMKLPAKTRIVQPQSLTMEQKLEVFRKAPMIQSFIKAVIKDLITHLLHGKKVGDLKLVEGRPTRKWIANETLVAEFLKEEGVTDPWIKKLKPLTEIEKKIGKGKLEDYTYKAPGKPKLVEGDDPRPAIKNRDAADLLDVLESDDDSED